MILSPVSNFIYFILKLTPILMASNDVKPPLFGGPEYQSLPAKEKHSLLWSNVLADLTPGEREHSIKILMESMHPSFDSTRDDLHTEVEIS